MRTTKLFTEGLALSASLTLIVTSYALWKNLPLSSLLYLAPLLIGMPLIGIIISRLSAQRISKTLLKQSKCPDLQKVFTLHLICTCILTYAVYTVLVYYQVHNAIILLPALSELGGALLFVLIFRFANSRAS